MQPSILILTDQHGQRVGAQLQAILQQEDDYQVGCLEGLLPKGTEVVESRPDLILPVLPAARERAEHLLATLRAQATCPPLMPVLQAVDLHQWPDGLHHWATDFLVTPLLRVPIKRAVSWLFSQGLILEIRRPGVPPYYQRHPQQHEAITKFLEGA